MKKLVLLTICIAVLLLLVSCDIGNLHTHAYGEWETIKEATCTEDGQRARSCSCGESEKEVISAKGHTEETVEDTPATCTEIGLTEGKKCFACGQVLVDQETVAALGHDFYYHEQTDDNGNTVTVVVCQRENCGEVRENPAGLYDAEGRLIASWAGLVNDYRLKFDHDDLKSGTKVIIDDSVTNISGTFENCTSLTDIYISKSVTRIDPYTFFGCTSLNNIEVDKDNEYFKSINGVLYNKDVTILWQYALGKEDKEFTVPDSVIFIREFAFLACTHLESLTIPDSVTYIAPYVFNDSPSLKNIYYEGTAEQWEAIKYNKGWLPNDVVIHYDGKKQFVMGVYVDISGSSSINPALVLMDDEKIFIDGVLYDRVSEVGNFEFEYTDNIYLYLENRGQTEEIEVLEKIESSDKWIILNGKADNGALVRRVICQVDGVYYVLLVPLNSQDGSAQKIYKIYSTIIDLVDFI